MSPVLLSAEWLVGPSLRSGIFLPFKLVPVVTVVRFATQITRIVAFAVGVSAAEPSDHIADMRPRIFSWTFPRRRFSECFSLRVRVNRAGTALWALREVRARFGVAGDSSVRQFYQFALLEMDAAFLASYFFRGPFVVSNQERLRRLDILP